MRRGTPLSVTGIAAAATAALILALPIEAAAQGSTPADLRLGSFDARMQKEASSLVGDLTFTNIGPIEMNGRLVDVEFPDPDEPYTFLIAYASGGLWKTANNGITFEPLFDDQASIIMGDVAVDPNDPDHLWVGTGEKNASRSTYSGTGLYRSTDGGASWTHAGLAETHRIGKIHISPADRDRIVVAAQGPLYTDSPHRGVYLSTDGGRSWEKTLYVDEVTGATDMAAHPTDPDVLYVAMWTKERKGWDFREGGPGSGVWRSDDGGATWTRLEGGLPRGDHVGRIGLATTPDEPDVVYASVDNQSPKPQGDQPEPSEDELAPEKLRTMTDEEFLALEDETIRDFLRRFHPDDTVEQVRELFAEGELSTSDLLDRLLEADPGLFDEEIIGAQVWRSGDRGASWELRNSDYVDGLYSTYGYYFGDIRVSPQDADVLYLLGVPLIKSTDGGVTWEDAGGRGVHADHQSFWIDPHHPEHLVDGNDGGLNVSWDGGESWLDITNVPAGQFYAITVDDADPYRVYGGLQDNGTWFGRHDRDHEDNTWERLGGGDGMRVQVDTRTNELVYFGSQFGNYRAADRAEGESWSVKPRSHIWEEYDRYNWQSPLLLSPHTPEIVYFGTQRLYRSFDQGRSFDSISGDLTTDREPGDVPYSTIVTLSESPLRFGLIYTGTDDGKVHVTRDGGVSWSEITRGLARDRYVSRVAASRHEEERVYAAQTGYRNDDWRTYLYRSDDSGRRWTSIRGDMPHEPVNVVREDPVHPEILYAGTDLGAWVTLDGGEHWEPFTGDLPHVPVHDIAVHEREKDVILGTHGRSIYVRDIEPIQHLLDEVEAVSGEDTAMVQVRSKPLHLFEVGDFRQERGWPRDQQRERPSWADPPELDTRELVYWTREPGEAELRLLDEEANPVRTFRDEAGRGLNVVAWDHTLDPELAGAAEEARGEEPEEAFEEWMTWFITPGTWTLEVEMGGRTESVTFEVQARQEERGRGR
ncbi:MAG: glycosyl hydrolase [bacterium]